MARDEKDKTEKEVDDALLELTLSGLTNAQSKSNGEFSYKLSDKG